MANYGTILVVDDNTSIFTTLEICLDGVFDRILTLTKPENILTTLEQEAVDVIIPALYHHSTCALLVSCQGRSRYTW